MNGRYAGIYTLKQALIVAALAMCGLAAGCAAGSGGGGVAAYSRDDDASGPLAGLTWLAGAWSGEDGDACTEEHWMRPRGKVMLGMNRVSGGAGDGFFEYLRIEQRADGIYYLASPAGRCPATPFRMTELEDGRAAFENPKHDFPRRIEYERSGDAMSVRISGEQDRREVESSWRWERSD